MFAIVPVKTKRALLPVKVNPDAGVKPVVVVKLNVVPAGGLINPIDANNISVEVNPFKTNPLHACPLTFNSNFLEAGCVMDCAMDILLDNNINITTSSFLITLHLI
jgi:hypothetical protein